MRFFNWVKFGAMVALVVGACGSRAGARERSSEPAVVTRYCSGCHGIKGDSQLPYIPRLSGLSSDYLNGKLARFRAAALSPVDEPFTRVLRGESKNHAVSSGAAVHMIGIANGVSEGDMKAAAQWYSLQQPAAGKTIRGDLAEQGRMLYSGGAEAQRLPACQTCHGSEGQGTTAAPRLAGQHAPYILAQLAHFRSGGPEKSPMTEVARSLERNQAQAIARYLQSR